MDIRRTCWVPVAAALVLATTGCGGTANVAEDSGPSYGSTAELEAIYRARQDSARMQYTDADVHFMTGMISHHAQALVMAALAPTHGASSDIQTLASRIDNAQRDEIASMQRWLQDRGQPVPQIHMEGTHLMIHGAGEHGSADHAMHMPGMLSQEQLLELDEAQGAEFDRLFLTYMIQHHSGAVVMVEELFATDGAALDEAAFKLASDIQVDQITEIERMERMLATLSGVSRDP